MRNFYLILAGISGLYLFIQLTAWLFFGKVLFPDAGELFDKRKNRLEWQTVFPKNMLRLIVFVFVGSVLGLLMDVAGLVGWISLPMAAVGGVAFNFLLNTAISPIYFKALKSGEPTDKELEGISGEVTEQIDPEGYGIIRVKHGRRSYYLNAVSANGRVLSEGTRVIVIYSEDKMCFAESEEHFFDVLFEDEPAPAEKEAKNRRGRDRFKIDTYNGGQN